SSIDMFYNLCISVLFCSFYYCSYNTEIYFFFFSSRRRHTRSKRDWSSDVCSSDLYQPSEENKTLINKITHLESSNHSDNPDLFTDRKSTRLNSSHVSISYAVFCLKKKKKKKDI